MIPKSTCQGRLSDPDALHAAKVRKLKPIRRVKKPGGKSASARDHVREKDPVRLVLSGLPTDTSGRKIGSIIMNVINPSGASIFISMDSDPSIFRGRLKKLSGCRFLSATGSTVEKHTAVAHEQNVKTPGKNLPVHFFSE